MSTEIAIPVPASPSDLQSWAERARMVHNVAISLAGTSFVPRVMQGRPDEVTGAILAGTELGLPPMAALRAIDIIDGTPAVRAHALRGIVQHHGHNVWLEESTENRAVVCGHRAGEQQRVQKSIWTIDRARKANLLGKKNWTGHTQAMLVARATAELCRLIASDAIIGMPYSSEELADETAGAETGPAEVTKVRKAARKIERPKEVAEPELEPATAEPTKAEDTENPGIGIRTRTALMAALSQAGYRERADRLAFCSQQVGRPVDSGNQLTEAEGMQIINTLNEMQQSADAGTEDKN